MDSMTISNIAKILSEESVVVQNWKQIFDFLKLEKAGSVSLGNRFNNGTITSYDLFREILEQWVSMEGNKGTVGVLVDILSSARFDSAADKVRALGLGPTLGSGFNFGLLKILKTFTGREAELEKLDNLISEDTFLVRITGLGGIGKTELAKAFAWKKFQTQTSSCIWLNSESTSSLNFSINKLCEKLEVPVKDEEKQRSCLLLMNQCFKKLSSVSQLLLVFDNLDEYNEEIVEFIGDLNGNSEYNFSSYVIITSRNISIFSGEGEHHPLDVFQPQESVMLIKKAFHEEEFKLAKLAETLQHFPLALQQAIAFIKTQKVESLSGSEYRINDYLEEFEKRKATLLDHRLGAIEHTYKLTTLITWDISLDRISKIDGIGKQAIIILETISYFLADNIPLSFISKLFGELQMTELKRYLKTFMLPIYREAIPLEVMQDLEGDDLEASDSAMFRALEYPISLIKNSYFRQTYFEHLERLFPQDLGYGSWTMDATQSRFSTAELSENLELCLIELGLNILLTRPIYMQCEEPVKLLKKNSMIKVENHQISIHRLVQEVTRIKLPDERSIFHLGRFARLFHLLDEDLREHELPHVVQAWKLIAKHSPTLIENRFYPNYVAERLNNLSLYNLAKEFCKTIASEMRKLNWGEKNAFLMQLKIGYATALFQQRKFNEALPMHESILQNQISLGGPASIKTLISLTNCAVVLIELGRTRDAKVLIEYNLRECDRALEEDKKRTRKDYDSYIEWLRENAENKHLGSILCSQFNAIEPVPLVSAFIKSYHQMVSNMDENQSEYAKVMDSNLKFYDYSKLRIAEVLLEGYNRLADTLYAKAEYDEAIVYANKAIDLALQNHGANKHQLRIAQSILALCLKVQEIYASAEVNQLSQLAGHILTECEKEHDHYSNEVKNTSNWLEPGSLAEVEKMILRGMLSSSVLVGDEHDSSLGANDHLANLLNSKSEFQGSGSIFNKIFASEFSKFGKKHPSVVCLAINLSKDLKEGGYIEKAIEVLKIVINNNEPHLRNKDQAITLAKSYLSEIYCDLGRNKEALPILEEIDKYFAAESEDDCNTPLTVRNNYGKCLIVLGRLKEGVEILRNLYPIIIRKLGDRNIDSIMVGCNLGNGLTLMGNLEEAEGILLPLFNISKSDLGENHSDHILIQMALATCLHKKNMGKLLYLNCKQFFRQNDESEVEYVLQLQEDVVQKLNKVDGQHLRKIEAMGSLAAILFDLGRFDEACKILKSKQSIELVVYGEETPHVVTTQKEINKCIEAKFVTFGFEEQVKNLAKAIALSVSMT